MNYSFAPYLLLRMPAKNQAQYAFDRQLFLDDQFFRAAVYLASPVFYATLERHDFLAHELQGKELVTLQKYINRYCYRPTPFGLFASITLLKWAAESTPLPENRSLTPSIQAAMPVQTLLSEHLIGRDLKERALYEANPSIYRVMNEYRFLRTGLDDDGRRREYQLQSIAFSRLLKTLAGKCETGSSPAELIRQLVIAAGCTPEEAADYAEFLIDAQFLLPVQRLTITGNDHLEGLAALAGPSNVGGHLSDFLRQSQDKATPISVRRLRQLETALEGLLPAVSQVPDKLSVLLNSPVPGATLTDQYQVAIRTGIRALELLNPLEEPPALRRFIANFHKHFEGQTIPLLQAMDPEAGPGYESPVKAEYNPLLETLHLPYLPASEQGQAWTTIHSILLERWLRNRSEVPVIRLTDDDLEKLRPDTTSLPMTGMSVLFRPCGEHVFIEQAGGVNAPALMGRFTLADQPIADAAVEMARQLEAQNPDLIFAELLQLTDPHIDNVNRRAALYQYELPITAASALPDTRQLQLGDLQVGVVAGKVLLYSVKHQKLVIPRLSSAYNHSLNRLPLFRFLADLSYQYGRSRLSLDLRNFFPGLGFYPRVEYKDTILSPATWVIPAEQLISLQVQQADQPLAFRKWQNENGLPRFFSLCEADQELVFDSHSEPDTGFLLECIRQKKELVIKEFLQPDGVRQYNAFLMPAEPLQLPRFPCQPVPSRATRKYLPGSPWLYLKIYAPKAAHNRLLLRLIPLLNRNYGGHRVGEWFFIRYEDHAPHIRLRLQVEPSAISGVLLAFKRKLENSIRHQVVREFQIDIYSRELERYQPGGIGPTEHFFYTGSVLVVQFLKRSKRAQAVDPYAFALYTAYRVIAGFLPAIDEQLSFTMDCFEQFLPEFASASIRIDLDLKYRQLTPAIRSVFETAGADLHSGSPKAGRLFIRSLQSILKNWKATKDLNYLRSIIHMHFNRVFTDEPRKQEMISYYFLHKHLRSVRARRKAGKGALSDPF